MKSALTILLSLIISNSFSQAFFIDPITTNGEYEAVQDSHMVVKAEGAINDKLFLFIGGTWSNTNTYKGLSEHAAALGFDVINLSYINNTPAAAYETDMDIDVFTDFRQELCYGTPLTGVDIDSLNSVYGRTLNLLLYLDATYPGENWDQYLLSSSEIDWSKILVGGHSQGAGHAAYFGKMETVDRVLMFAGPNDYSTYHAAPATWLTNTGLTLISKYFSFLHTEDNVVDYSSQLINIQGLGIYPLYDTINVETNSTPYNNSRCLIMTRTTGLVGEHSKMILNTNANKEVWSYMLTSDITTDISENRLESTPNLYPNPAKGIISTELPAELRSKPYAILNSSGVVVSNGATTEESNLQLGLTGLKPGVYTLKIHDRSVRFIIE